MSVALSPLTPSLGVEAVGVDLGGPVASEDLSTLQKALSERLVMVVRGQNFTPERFLDAARLFGDLMPQHLTNILMPGHPEIVVLDSRQSDKGEDGKAIPTGSRAWHTDHTNHARPPKITMLYAVKLPSKGGDTSFANMQAAYEGLSAEERDKLNPMITVNVIEQDTGSVGEDARQALTKAPQRHPLIRTHPETGKKAIYVHPGKTERIDGMEPAESRAFIQDLLARAITPDVTYRHTWRPGDLVLWDNRATLHIAHRDYDASEGRIMHRVILEGEVPV
ncbi:TauD/TfdA family dioxygenase [Thalassospiraceae bacterium LMO-SO8]|nr:TauD/TfdA family dioxygenase [Alphaproteobacteria bacterium LMO-S08]WND76583.1 TauD/TfdA family dioxygenase [Thalassospiraceae bacterium LMO-SO8]